MRVLADHAGYSLVEVMVAIMILAVAIIPMVSMFDAGLRAAVMGSTYDRARSLADEQLEEVRALPYKKPGGASDSVIEAYDPAAGTVDCDEGIFACEVETWYVDATFGSPGKTPPTPQMQVRVRVQWEGKTYTTTGFVAGG